MAYMTIPCSFWAFYFSSLFFSVHLCCHVEWFPLFYGVPKTTFFVSKIWTLGCFYHYSALIIFLYISFNIPVWFNPAGSGQNVIVLTGACSRVCYIHDVTIPPMQEQRCRQGDDSVLQKALDESRRESQSGTHEVSLKMCVYEQDSLCLV